MDEDFFDRRQQIKTSLVSQGLKDHDAMSKNGFGTPRGSTGNQSALSNSSDDSLFKQFSALKKKIA